MNQKVKSILLIILANIVMVSLIVLAIWVKVEHNRLVTMFVLLGFAALILLIELQAFILNHAMNKGRR
ncbi:MAG: hypothetical protein K6G48_02465 [Acholeplasmatales bacterium]|nr:hypothetical protein [Acholeplasmatales bacterium]